LKQEVRHFVASEDAKLVSENTYELMSYLLDLFKEGRLKPPTNSISRKFVYHMPCHLLAIGGGQVSIELLDKLCKIEAADLKAGCCGLAGTFGMQKKNYELSSQIAARLKEALEKAPTEYVLTECAACKMQIEHISASTVLHPVKLLVQAYRRD
jgi:Fe-S oxidoreductase